MAGEVLVEVSPEALEAHNKVKTAVSNALAGFAEQRDLGEVYSDGALVTNEEAGLSTQPRRPIHLSRRSHVSRRGTMRTLKCL